MEQRQPPKILRRIAGAGICFCPAVLLVVSLCSGMYHERPGWSGGGFMLAAVLFAGLNFYLSCQRALKTSQGWADENQPL
jgi:hypothetical protein